MQFRNAKYNAHGSIDCEIEHPHFGWIPFTASKDDVEEHGRQIYEYALTMNPEAYVAPPPPTQVELLEEARQRATLPRYKFLIACANAGIITEAAAEEASEGKWPTEFDAFLSGLTPAERIEAKAIWLDGKSVKRTSTLLGRIAAEKNVTPEGLDNLFGIVV